VKKMTMLCFAPAFNTKGRKDATGAFIPEAKRFLEHHGQNESMLRLIDNTQNKAQMRKAVLRHLKEFAGHGLDGVFFFCHGWRRGIQFGFTSKNLKKLAAAIFDACDQNPRMVFYSCDVARDSDRHRADDLKTMGGDGGFADEMRDALCMAGARWCRVDGHTTRGHTTRNPHVRRFEGNGSHVGGLGGYYIVPRQKKKLFKKWRELLRTDFRFDYPFRSSELILIEVGDH
jgi:hypothetical protein